MRRPNLVAAGGAKGQHDQRALDLAQHPIVEPGRRQSSLVRGKITFDVASDGPASPSSLASRPDRLASGCRRVRLDHPNANHLLRIKRCQASNQILQFADIARPAIGAQPLHRGIV